MLAAVLRRPRDPLVWKAEAVTELFRGRDARVKAPTRRVIWDRHGNPVPYVSKRLGIDPYVCSDTLHRIKDGVRLGQGDNTTIYDNGDVANAVSGEDIGNLYDDA